MNKLERYACDELTAKLNKIENILDNLRGEISYLHSTLPPEHLDENSFKRLYAYCVDATDTMADYYLLHEALTEVSE
jgi:hypothetical protein